MRGIDKAKITTKMIKITQGQGFSFSLFLNGQSGSPQAPERP
jgi:hypothetical protein